MSVDKYYPVQGSNKFQTVSFPITKAVAIDFGAQGSSGTAATFSLPKGSLVLGFAVRFVEAYESTGASAPVGVKLGFTGTELLTSPITSSVGIVGAVVGPSTTAVKVPRVLTADDTFDVIIGASGGALSGKVDVFITYVPIPVPNLSTKEFLSYVTSS